MSKTGLYLYPKLNRAGLGNLLFPWARCEIAAARHGLPVLAPQWTQPKIGPLLRREKDKRYYLGLFSNRGYVRGLKRAWLMWSAQRVAEDHLDEAMSRVEARGKELVVFEGMSGLYQPLHGHRELLARRMEAILTPSVRERVTMPATASIGVHIRHGDKIVMSDAGRRPANWTDRISDDWYLAAIQDLRRVLGVDAPVVIFTDARAHEIAPLMALPNVTLAEENPSIVDILRLAKSKIIIGSCSSTFSMWSVFLGAMPSIWYPSIEDYTLTPDKAGFQITTALDGTIPESSAEVLRKAFAGP